MRIRDLLVFITLYSMIFGAPRMFEYLYHGSVTLEGLIIGQGDVLAPQTVRLALR